MELINHYFFGILVLVLYIVLVLQLIWLYRFKLKDKKLDYKELKQNFGLTNGDSKQFDYIIELFKDIEESIWIRIKEQYERNKFHQSLICILGLATLTFESFIFSEQSKNIKDINLFLFSAFILIILTILISNFLFIYKSTENKIRNYDNALIICSYQRTALLTAIQLNDKEMISKNLANLAEIDQSFFSEKKSDFE